MKNKYKHIGKILVMGVCAWIILAQSTLAAAEPEGIVAATDGKIYDQGITVIDSATGMYARDDIGNPYYFQVFIHRGIWGTSVTYLGKAYTLKEARKMYFYPKSCGLPKGFDNYDDTDEEWLVDGVDYTPLTITTEEKAFFDNAFNSGILTIDYLGQGFATGAIDKKKVAAWLEGKDINELIVIEKKLFFREDPQLYGVRKLDRYCNPMIVKYNNSGLGTCTWEDVYEVAYPPIMLEDPEPYYG